MGNGRTVNGLPSRVRVRHPTTTTLIPAAADDDDDAADAPLLDELDVEGDIHGDDNGGPLSNVSFGKPCGIPVYRVYDFLSVSAALVIASLHVADDMLLLVVTELLLAGALVSLCDAGGNDDDDAIIAAIS